MPNYSKNPPLGPCYRGSGDLGMIGYGGMPKPGAPQGNQAEGKEYDGSPITDDERRLIALLRRDFPGMPEQVLLEDIRGIRPVVSRGAAKTVEDNADQRRFASSAFEGGADYQEYRGRREFVGFGTGWRRTA